MTHLESRPSKTNPGSEYDFYMDCVCPTDKKEELLGLLRANSLSVNVLSRDPGMDEGVCVCVCVCACVCLCVCVYVVCACV